MDGIGSSTTRLNADAKIQSPPPGNTVQALRRTILYLFFVLSGTALLQRGVSQASA